MESLVQFFEQYGSVIGEVVFLLVAVFSAVFGGVSWTNIRKIRRCVLGQSSTTPSLDLKCKCPKCGASFPLGDLEIGKDDQSNEAKQ